MTTQTPAPTATSTRRKLAYAAGGALVLLIGIGIGIGSANSTPTAPATASPDLQGLIDQANANAKVDGAATAADTAAANTGAKFAAPPAPVGPVTSFADGTFVVGGDIKAGTYKANPAGECYWARLSSTSSESDIIANHLANGPTTVTISAGDKAFVSTDCGTWAKVG